MMEDLEMFYADGLGEFRATSEVLAFAKQIVKWKMQGMQMFPDDVIGYMIQENVISETEILGLLVEQYLTNEKTLDIVLPKKYNI